MIMLKYHPFRFSELKEIMVEMGNRRELKSYLSEFPPNLFDYETTLKLMLFVF